MRQRWKEAERETVREESRCSGLCYPLSSQRTMKAYYSPLQVHSATAAADHVVVGGVVGVVVGVVVGGVVGVAAALVAAAVVVAAVVAAAVVVVVVVVVAAHTSGAAVVSAVVAKSPYCPVEVVEGCTGCRLQGQGGVCDYGRSDTLAVRDHSREFDLREERGPACDSMGCTRGIPLTGAIHSGLPL